MTTKSLLTRGFRLVDEVCRHILPANRDEIKSIISTRKQERITGSDAITNATIRRLPELAIDQFALTSNSILRLGYFLAIQTRTASAFSEQDKNFK